jgi:hypothetical protein
MPDTSPNLKAQYLTQVEADLERNTKEKERIAAELAALQEQLTVLQQDHALLTGVQQTLTGATAVPEQETKRAAAQTEAQAAVPPARKPRATSRTPKPSVSKKETKAAKPAASGGGPAATTPTLVELVTANLSGHTEPRSAAEVGTSLVKAHPARKIQTTVVRNTLEALVAKGQALRSKQGRSVYYTAPDTTPAADEPAQTTPATA